jgi:hypothetical protein
MRNAKPDVETDMPAVAVGAKYGILTELIAKWPFFGPLSYTGIRQRKEKIKSSMSMETEPRIGNLTKQHPETLPSCRVTCGDGLASSMVSLNREGFPPAILRSGATYHYLDCVPGS